MRGHKKGTYVDGHERSDIVEYGQKFLRKMFSLGFLNKDNAASPTAQENFPSDLESPPADQIKKTIVLFHDESTLKLMKTKHITGEPKTCISCVPRIVELES